MIKIKFILALLITILNNDFCAQNRDSTNSFKTDTSKKIFGLKTAFTITNKGVSYIPNLSLGKPAMLFDLSLGNQKTTFEPQLRFSLNGEPWSFIFPVRYKVNPKGKFQLTAGAIPLLNFKSVTYTVNCLPVTDLVNRRYIGGELKPSYFFTKYISVSIQYLYFNGISERTVKNTSFVSLVANFSKIKLCNSFFARFTPQLYYLRQDGKEGFYFNSVITLFKRDFPLCVQTNMNTIIHGNIPGGTNFIWNASLIYIFNRSFIRKTE